MRRASPGMSDCLSQVWRACSFRRTQCCTPIVVCCWHGQVAEVARLRGETAIGCLDPVLGLRMNPQELQHAAISAHCMLIVIVR